MSSQSSAKRTVFHRPLELRPDARALLGRWLGRTREHHIEYGGFLSNHIVYTYIVCAAAGSPEADYEAWHARYSEKLEPVPDPDPRRKPVTEADWTSRLEDTRESYYEYLQFYDARVAELGVAGAVRRYVPALMPGMVGAALHGTIHAGWGVEAGSDRMTAEGLAYMSVAFQPLASGVAGARPLWTADAGAAGHSVSHQTERFLRLALERGLPESSRAASDEPRYVALGRGRFQHRVITFDDPALPHGEALCSVGPLHVAEGDAGFYDAAEESVATVAAAVRSSGNELFFVHAATSLLATLAMAEHLEPKDRRDALAHWWRGSMAAMVAQGAPGAERTAELLAEWRRERKAGAEGGGSGRGGGGGGGGGGSGDGDDTEWWMDSMRRGGRAEDEHHPKALLVFWRWSRPGLFSAATQRLCRQAAEDLMAPRKGGAVAGDDSTLSKNLRMIIGF